MDGEARQLPPEPGETEEAILRAAGAWPLDARGYSEDPVSREPRHWSVLVKLLQRDAAEATPHSEKARRQERNPRKPTAHISAHWSGPRGGVLIYGDALSSADLAAAIDAAVAASSWCARRDAGVSVAQPAPPPGRRRMFGGGYERDYVRYATRSARDAAKAVLKARGYAVRGGVR